jgi:hypothetical protein
MNESSITDYITSTFEGVHAVTADGNIFYMHEADEMFPISTLMTNDLNDRASNLDRPSVFRLNIGVSKETYHSLFGPPPARPGPDGIVDTGHDFTALDQLMPHPVYANMYWVCVVSPSAATFETTLVPLLAEAYELAVRKHARRAARARTGGAQ